MYERESACVGMCVRVCPTALLLSPPCPIPYLGPGACTSPRVCEDAARPSRNLQVNKYKPSHMYMYWDITPITAHLESRGELAHGR